jgi:hypothetical protein
MFSTNRLPAVKNGGRNGMHRRWRVPIAYD